MQKNVNKQVEGLAYRAVVGAAALAIAFSAVIRVLDGQLIGWLYLFGSSVVLVWVAVVFVKTLRGWQR